ncbi:hypothetical protein RR48_01286 [Papilio machaon]|uniref:Uncharacterized protein n=1 Tax=Papilio machaon TaxID=76193 RepID=A0A0N1PKB0_PAPMA|nr:hypothetical protein RR48_01286 [Papilio machaon]
MASFAITDVYPSCNEETYRQRMFPHPMRAIHHQNNFPFPSFLYKKSVGRETGLKLSLRNAQSFDKTKNYLRVMPVCVVVLLHQTSRPFVQQKLLSSTSVKSSLNTAKVRQCFQPPEELPAVLPPLLLLTKELELLPELLLAFVEKTLEDAEDKIEKTAKKLASKASEDAQAAIKEVRAAIASAGKLTDEIEKSLKDLEEKVDKIKDVCLFEDISGTTQQILMKFVTDVEHSLEEHIVKMSKLSLLTGSVVLLVALAVFSTVEAGRPPPQKREPLDVKKKLEELSEKIAKILKDAKEKAEKTAKAIAAKASEEVKAAIKDAQDALAAAQKINAKVEEAFENLAKKIEKAINDIAKGNQ